MIRSYSPERQANITREASKIELYSEISESDEDAGYPMFGGTDISIPAIIEFFTPFLILLRNKRPFITK